MLNQKRGSLLKIVSLSHCGANLSLSHCSAKIIHPTPDISHSDYVSKRTGLNNPLGLIVIKVSSRWQRIEFYTLREKAGKELRVISAQHQITIRQPFSSHNCIVGVCRPSILSKLSGLSVVNIGIKPILHTFGESTPAEL
jgi:hypothetical protein